MNVLIVDDQSSARTMLRRILQDLSGDLSLHDFASPVEALEFCKHNRPDLIIIDYRMPEMDGVQFARTLRRSPELHNVPLLVVTVVIDDAMHLAALEAGVDGICIKPVIPRELQARAKRLLTYREVNNELAEQVRKLQARHATQSAA